METEKRIRREIANSNERRRMQSINAGFQSLRTLLPRHEGEKLSKAAILQQTAEYIYILEQEKTQLLSQNCQLKRLLSQHEGGEIPLKKRKEKVMLADCAVLSETSDDVAGSVSPDPITIVSVTSLPNTANISPNSELADLQLKLERERQMRMALEDQMQSLESHMYPESIGDLPHQITLQYENTEVIEQSDVLRDMVSVALVPDESLDNRINDADEMQLVSIDAVAEHHTVAESDACSRPVSPVDMAIVEEEEEEEQRSSSPIIQSPLLEAAIKAEPKVEVEVLPGPGTVSPGEPSRLFLASTSRQNLETIVEAIRHLEGDHMFAEEQPGREQELPLALTNKPDQRRLRVDMNDYLHFHHPQSRPGVIVGKHS
ncbi:transcription factor cropped [Arctopsyche grandis]|uniref:transcription factor cropped n=1 Tax=Arctopsyche grandis TaxID=121162 RepID=UPI00406D7D56